MFINNKVSSNSNGSGLAAGAFGGGIDAFQQLQSVRGLLTTSSSASVLPIQNRKVRDSGSFLVLVAFLGFLAYVVWDGLIIKQVDINLIVHGHDSYGNICGRNNKPIHRIPQSGKNFTDKPYSKYTLINAQFERYTLDTGKFSNGEIYYIKESDFNGDLQPSSRLRANFSSSSHILEPRTSTQTIPNKNSVRTKRSSPIESHQQVVGQHHKLVRELALAVAQLRNESDQQVTVTKLRSRLLHPLPRLEADSASAQVATATFPQTSAKTTSPTIVKAGDPRNAGSDDSGGVNGQGWPLDAAASSVIAEAINRRAHASGNATLRSATPLSASSTAPPLRGAGIGGGGIRIDFDETQPDNEHVMVSNGSGGGGGIDARRRPQQNDIEPRQPGTNSVDGYNQFEAGSQLLYLTECVDKCPDEHLELIFYRCMPKNWRFALFPNAINVTTTFIEDVLTDLTHCQKELVYVFSLALVMSLTLLILLRYLAAFIIWLCISLLICIFVSLASYAWLNYYYLIMDLNNSIPSHDQQYADKLASSDRWLLGSIFLTFVAIAAIATVAFMRKRILMVTMLFRESGKAIADMPLLLLQPVLTFAVLCAITALWCLGLICLQSMKTPVIDLTTGFVVFKAETLYKVMKWYHVFAYLWLSHFAIACQHYVIGASVSKWYFSTNRYNLNSPIGSSVSELILYYLGSVALGSFLVAIFRVIRIIMRQIQILMHKNCLASQNGTDSPVGSLSSANDPTRNSLGHTSCCGSFTYVSRLFVWFLDNVVMAINRDAYVEISIYGGSFLQSAKRAFNVMASNPFRLLAIKTVGSSLLTVAKICVVLGTVGVTVLLLNDASNQLKHWWAPIVLAALYAYIVAHWFLSVYDMVIDALFICYCEDYKRSKSEQEAQRINGTAMMTQFVNDTNNMA